MKLNFLLFFFVVQFSNLLSQPQNYIHFTVADGLPQSQIVCLFQDSKGYLWIGTKGGVSRYDGFTFQNFSINQGLSSNIILKIMEDSKGTVWVCTRKSLCKYTGTGFLEYPCPNQNINGSAAIDDNDNIYISTATNQSNQLLLFNNGNYKTVNTLPDGKDWNIHNIFFDKNTKNLWLATSKGLYYIKNEQIHDFNAFKENELLGIYNNTDRNLICAKNGSIYEVKNSIVQQMGRIDKSYFQISFCENRNDSVVFCTSNTQIMELSPNGKSKIYLNFKMLITALLIDRESNYWLGTENGLYKLSPFYNYSKETGMPDYVWSIVEDNKQQVWFASFYGKLAVLQNDSMLDFLHSTVPFYMGSIKTSKGILYFTTSDGIQQIKGKTLQPIDKYPNDAVFFIMEDKENDNIMLSTDSILYFQHEDSFIAVDTFSLATSGIVLSIIKGADNNYWLLSGKNIVRFDFSKLLKMKARSSKSTLSQSEIKDCFTFYPNFGSPYKIVYI